MAGYLDMTDEELLHSFTKKNSHQAIQTLLERHMTSAYQLALKYMKNQADAEDVVQKAFLNVIKFSADQKHPGMVKAWIMKIVINTSKNEIKHLMRQRKLHEKKPMPQQEETKDKDIDNKELKDICLLAIEKLPDHFRVPIWLSYYEGMTIKEISHSIGKPENTIRTQVSRGLLKLKQILKGRGFNITSMTVASILTTYKKAEAVPPTLQAKVQAIARLRKSSRMLTTTSAKSAFPTTLIPLLVVTIGLISSYKIYFTENKTDKFSELRLPITDLPSQNEILKSENNNLNFFHDFNSQSLPYWLTITNAKYKFIQNSATSSCLKITEPCNFQMKLNLPQITKAFKASYQIKYIKGKGKNAPLSTLNKVSQDQTNVTYCFFTKLKIGVTYSVDIYVQENIQAIYFNNQLYIVSVSKEKFHKDYYLQVTNMVANIDNLIIRELKEYELKKFQKCIDMADLLLKNKKFQKIGRIPSPLPEITTEKIEVRRTPLPLHN